MSRYDPYENAVAFKFSNGDISLDRLPQQVGIVSSYTAIHTVKADETMQSIAHKYYKDSGRWVDIADINSIYNPLLELKPGMLLVIP